jgi:hypothetical protein
MLAYYHHHQHQHFTNFRKGSTKGLTWLDGTVQKALQLKFSCGHSGYDTLLKQGLPYPSIITLQRRLKNIAFDDGVLHSAFKLLKIKVSVLA